MFNTCERLLQKTVFIYLGPNAVQKVEEEVENQQFQRKEEGKYKRSKDIKESPLCGRKAVTWILNWGVIIRNL